MSVSSAAGCAREGKRHATPANGILTNVVPTEMPESWNRQRGSMVSCHLTTDRSPLCSQGARFGAAAATTPQQGDRESLGVCRNPRLACASAEWSRLGQDTMSMERCHLPLQHILPGLGLEHTAGPGAHGPQCPPGRGWLHAADGGDNDGQSCRRPRVLTCAGRRPSWLDFAGHDVWTVGTFGRWYHSPSKRGRDG